MIASKYILELLPSEIILCPDLDWPKLRNKYLILCAIYCASFFMFAFVGEYDMAQKLNFDLNTWMMKMFMGYLNLGKIKECPYSLFIYFCINKVNCFISFCQYSLSWSGSMNSEKIVEDLKIKILKTMLQNVSDNMIVLRMDLVNERKHYIL